MGLSPHRNITGQEWKALEALRKDKSVLVLKVDKGNVTVVLDQGDYQKKLTGLLTYEAYHGTKKDHMGKVERRPCKLLKEANWPVEIYSALKPKAAHEPPMYGAPMIHNVNYLYNRVIDNLFGRITEALYRTNRIIIFQTLRCV